MMETIIAVSVGLRALVGRWSYSGAGNPPMFGDFEAQRHWMEITVSLPIKDWYRNTSENDLLYWGLDYPPLTAYVSWAFGKIAELFVPMLVELQTSRGYESCDGKTFMRCTVILCDLIVLLPSIYLSSNALRSHESIRKKLLLLSCFVLPGLLLIDHGHFQYNGVCIGFTLLGFFFILKDRDIIGSIFFCLSLNFKQMSLYYAPVFFFSLLGKCFKKPTILQKLNCIIKLGVTVITTFAILWMPFCIFTDETETCVSSILQVLHRQFPFSRGIFEDKVANLWYSFSIVIDFRNFMTTNELVFCSLVLTLLLLSPIAVNLLLKPLTAERFVLSLINSALAFFLASYQVHEKSILLASVPAGLLISLDLEFFAWFQLISIFTMFPLLVKDQLRVPYFLCSIIYTSIVFLASKENEGETDKREEPMNNSKFMNELINFLKKYTLLIKRIFLVISFLGMVVLHLMEVFIKPPSRYPDLYPALFSIYGAANFLVMYLVCIIWQWTLTSNNQRKKRK